MSRAIHSGFAAARGFTLLEAIVAMTLFAMGAVALYGWQAQSLHAVQRVQARQAYVAAVEATLPLIEAINPMQEPSGERRVADLVVRWHSELLQPVHTGKTRIGQASMFDVGLYRVDVEVERQQLAVAKFNLRRPGYRKVRQAEAE